MGSRIITLQRQARELGRLRTGYTDTTGPRARPVRSQTWIITSHAEHYVQAAADVWGGTVEKWQPLGNGAAQWRVITTTPSLDAILPPGDPMSQCYEAWTKGGAQRRCDGMTESLSDSPCVCRARWGDNFHEVAPKDEVCKVTTRLNVILPEMPDIGAWRVETHSFYSANEMAAAVDVLKGSLGEGAMIPVRLRIEQRTRVAAGKTKQFPVIAVELRGGTAGQILSGTVQAPAVAAATAPAVGGASRTAIEAPRQSVPPSAEDMVAAALGCASLDDLSVNLKGAQHAGFARNLQDAADPVAAAFMRRRGELTAPAATPQPQPAPADAIWQQIITAWPGTTSELNDTFPKVMCGLLAESASAADLDTFLTKLRAGELAETGSAT